MKKQVYPTLVILCICVSALTAQAQKVTLDMDFKTQFDNREYNSSYVQSQTIFGMKLRPEIGLSWADGQNSVKLGMDATFDFGRKGKKRTPELLLYFEHNGDKGFSAIAGVFKRDKLLGNYPTLFFNDSIKFYDAILEGALFSYRGKYGYIEAACDWNGMMSKADREKFMLISSGSIGKPGGYVIPYAGYYMTVYHFSHSEEVWGVVDNIVTYLLIGADAGRSQSWSFGARAGWVQAMQRDRRSGEPKKTPHGFMGEAYVQWRSIKLHNTIYAGGNLMPYYDRYGTELYFNDPYFRTTNNLYDRVELSWMPRLKDGLSLKVSTIHHFDGKTWGWQQMVSFVVKLDKDTFRRK
jgi:hypothetical protein